jgi:hypothetical protein
MTILSVFERFAFSILSCDLESASSAIRQQGSDWKIQFSTIELIHRDARTIYCSADGPNKMPSAEKGLILSELNGKEGPRTLFLSNVADGYSSMVFMLSKIIRGVHLSFEVSNMTVRYPRNAITASENGNYIRVVYSMLDGDKWQFFEKGSPLKFEDVGRYRARRKKDRLNPEIVASVLEMYGYGSLDSEFWITDSVPARLICDAGFKPWHP